MSSEVFKELFSVLPNANTPTASPSPAAGKAWVISRLNICNVVSGDGADYYSVQANDGAYLAFKEQMSQNQHDLWNGVTMNTGEVLTFWSKNGDIQFVAYGSEVTY